MELFKPSKKILEMISPDGSYLSNYEFYLRKDIKNQIRNVYNSFFPSLCSKFSLFYKFDSEKNREFFQSPFVIVGEMFKNCIEHGKGNVGFGLFLGDNGACYAFCDEGDYFKENKIKFQYENKIPLKNLKRKTKRNRRRGVENIFSNSDLIEVDSRKGILYCVQLKESIIAPEGKDGNQYCWELKKKTR